MENYDNELMKKFFQESKSYSEVCNKLDISSNGYNINKLKDYVRDNDIDISHFKFSSITKRLTRDIYNQNPKYCKCCGEIIAWEKRNNLFCSKSCSTSFNNSNIIRNPSGYNGESKSKLNEISDEQFVKCITENSGWDKIVKSLGYSSVSSFTKNKIKERAAILGVEINIKSKTKKDWSQITKKELFDSRSNWQSARTQIRKGAEQSFNGECKCIICGYNKHIEIAHIKAVSEFSDDTPITEINNSNNLIPLCPNHHWEYDNGLLDITQYINYEQS